MINICLTTAIILCYLLQLQDSGSREFDYLGWIFALQWLTLLKVGTYHHHTETPSEVVVWRSPDLMSVRRSSTACQNSADNLICSNISKRNNRKTLELVVKNRQMVILWLGISYYNIKFCIILYSINKYILYVSTILYYIHYSCI